MKEYQLIVGNIGTVYTGTNLFEAKQQFYSYRRDSINESGRAAGESVTLFHDSVPFLEYEGTQSLVDSGASDEDVTAAKLAAKKLLHKNRRKK